jgi:hypothetical protein
VTDTDGLRQPYSDDLWMGWLTDALCEEGATPTAAERYASALLPLIRAAWAEQQQGALRDAVLALAHEWERSSATRLVPLTGAGRDLRAVVAGAVEERHEWQCPSCGATTRARMADRIADLVATAKETE